MAKLTGLQRFTLTALWIKKGKEEPKETFIKKVCDVKGIEYTPPTKVSR